MNAQAIAINPISQTHPSVAAQWHSTRNGELLPDMVTYGSAKKVWWRGECGHEWEAVVANRTTRGSGCPYCARRNRTLPFTHPKLADQWHPSKNEGLEASDVTYGTKRKVWWVGQCGHEWRASVSNRARGESYVCPKCSVRKRQRVTLGETHPSLAEQWHPLKNGEVSPQDVSRASNNKAWWLGPCGHTWEATIKNRVAGAGCPVCSGHKVLKGFNDLATTKPDIAKWWHPTRNENLRPTDVTSGSAKKVWWVCPGGHEWERSVANMRTSVCPQCGADPADGGMYRGDVVSRRGRRGKIPMPEFLIEQWHPTRNGKLRPQQVSGGSGRKVWWQCNREHSWRATVASRRNGSGCPICNSGASEVEKEVREAVKGMTGYNVLHNVRGGFLGRLELDIYVPDVAVGIEFNGEYWHDETVFSQAEESHARKQAACGGAGVRLVVVWEDDWRDNRDDVIFGLRSVLSGGDVPKSMTYEARRVGKITSHIPAKTCETHDVDHPRQRPRARSVAEYSPLVASQWHPSNNGDLTPFDVTFGTSKKVWWVCDKGHEWEASIRTRTVRGYGCPTCRRKPGTPVIEVEHFSMWDHDKNRDLNPAMLTTGSRKEAWWRCPEGHAWRDEIAKVLRRKNAFPKCPNRKRKQSTRSVAVVHTPENPLSKTHPNVASQWHPMKNGELQPSNVTAGSRRRVWWLCDNCGREWKGEVKQRVKSPRCSRCTPTRGATKANPLAEHLVSQWHPTKNEWLRPDMVTAGSSKKVWWICVCGNVWSAIVANRTNGSGCPKCARRNRHKVSK